MKGLLVSVLVLSVGWCASAPSPPSFFARHDYPGYTWSLATDVNGDGVLDLVATNGGDAQVMLGDGQGNFRMLQSGSLGLYYGSGDPPAAAVDMNGDGKVDLVIAGRPTSGFTPSGVAVCLGNGDGTFQKAVFYQAGTDRVAAVVVADFNGDGIPDVATHGVSGIWLFTGKGDGTLNAGILMPLPSSGPFAPAEFVAAYFNGDGYIDLAAITPTGFAVLIGNGDGTFQAPRATATPEPVGFVVAGDLNLDGHPDLVFTPTDTKANRLQVYLGNGDGSFAGPTHVEIPTSLIGGVLVAVGDVNGDGFPDLVNGTGYIVYGRGDGTFKKPIYRQVDFTGNAGTNPVLADLRNNGETDIVAGGTSILLAWGKGRVQEGGRVQVPGGGSCGATADYNLDGKADIAISTRSGGIAMALGTGNPLKPFVVRSAFSLKGADCAVQGDLNGDGIPDLLVPVFDPKTLSGKIYAYLGRGDGTFRRKGYTAIPSHTAGYIVLGDFDGDGKLDFALSTNLLARGNGDGTFRQPVPFMPNPPSTPAALIVRGDLNGDGWPDLVVADPNQPNIDILLNNRAGGFTQTEVNGQGCTGAPWVSLGDLNGDGNIDMVVTWTVCSTCHHDCPNIYLGDGKGGFFGMSSLIANGSINVIGDVNGDGIPDIVSTGTGSLAIALGNGDGTFNYPACIGNIAVPLSESAQGGLCLGAGPEPGYWYLMNLFGQSQADGVPDIVVPDVSGAVWALYNTTKH